MLTVSTKLSKPRVTYDPAGFKKARKQYDQGNPKALITMMQEAATDSYVAGCLIGRRAGFKRKFDLRPYDDSEAAAERARWYADVFRRLHLRQLLEDVHDGRLYLYHVIDFEWEVVRGRQTPVAYEAFAQHHFRYESKGGPLRIDFGTELREIPEEALVVEARKGPIMLPVLRDFILSEFGVEAWASFLENFGEPFIIGKYPSGAGDEFKKELEDGINAMGASTRGVAPEGSSVEVITANRTTGDHSAFRQEARTGISIALLGHGNAVQNSPGLQVGENTTSLEVRWEIAEDDMWWIEPWINRFIERIGERNFGDGAYPVFELNKQRPVDAREFTEIAKTWFDMGAIIDPDDMGRAGLKVSEDQEPMQRQQTSVDLLMSQ